jgi:hypothetical protein
MKKLFIISLFVIFMSLNAQAIDYDDGQEHDIRPDNDIIYIYNADVHQGDPTIVNLVSGGVVSSVDVYDTSIFNLFTGGEVLRVPSGSETHSYSSITSHNDSQVTMWGGTAYAISALDTSYAEMWDGTIDEFGAFDFSRAVMQGGIARVIGALDDGHFTMSGGLADSAYAFGNGHLEILDGQVSSLKTFGNSTSVVSDGPFGDIVIGDIEINDDSHVEISGGGIGMTKTYGNSTIDISGGITSQLLVNENSMANISANGEIHNLSAGGNSHVDITGGNILNVSAGEFSHVSMTDVDGVDVDSYGDSIVEISNAIVNHMYIQDSAQVTITDSHIEDRFDELRMNSSLNLTNTSFGQMRPMEIYDTSHLTVSMETSLLEVRAFDNSTLTLSGGFVNRVRAEDESLTEISEGDIDILDASGNSTVEITMGFIEHLDASGNSTVEITMGFIEYLNVSDNAQVDILGGHICRIIAHDLGLIRLSGSEFNYDYGYITDTSGTLTGTLLSGEEIHFDFYLSNDAAILLVPEPTTLLLLGMGGLLIRKRK